ncbi:MAG: DNA gyrase inhibitor YacG [Candidatus Scalindua sp.]|nr:DNA gyrase inhibitor YacG [Candidatus Scalindua sp.]
MSKIKCRSCGKELFYNSISDIPTFPFCSERCKLTDLGSWFNEERSIEGPATNDKLEDYNE